jgi:hypothetical protein
LPEITFVGGETQTIHLRLFTPQPEALPFDANDCLVNFAIINSSNKIGVPILSKYGSVLPDESGVPNIVSVRLLPMETAMLYGKYIYQITVIEISGDVEIPNQGHMFITKNINQNFILNQ